MTGTHSETTAYIYTQSAHPLALFCLYLFRVTAITVYILCGWFTDNYVLSVCVTLPRCLDCLAEACTDGCCSDSIIHGLLELQGAERNI
jgi:hypothetical protein